MKIAYINLVVSSTTFLKKKKKIGFASCLLSQSMWWALGSQGVDLASVPATGTEYLAWTNGDG